MYAEDRNGLRVYRFERLPAPKIDVLVSTRSGGVSAPPYSSLNLGLRVHDDDARVLENRRRLFDAFELQLERSAWCNQPHKSNVALVTEGEMRGGDRGAFSEVNTFQGADALVTQLVGVSICITVADCVPIVLYDPHHHAAAVVHAGWRGMVGRIASRTVQGMQRAFGTDPEVIVAAIGPSIAPEEFEVGADVVDGARAAFGDAPVLRHTGAGKAYFDLWESALVDLGDAGVPRKSVEVARKSTMGALGEFYSHRAEGETGRIITAVTLR